MSLQRRVMLVGVAVLLAVLGVTAAGCLAVLGSDAVHGRAIAVAAAVAGGGAVTGWIVARQARGGPVAAAVAGGLAATLVRLLPLLVALAWLTGPDQSPWAGAAVGLLVVFHLAMLATDMVLNSLADRWAVRTSRSPESRPSAGADIAN